MHDLHSENQALQSSPLPKQRQVRPPTNTSTNLLKFKTIYFAGDPRNYITSPCTPTHHPPSLLCVQILQMAQTNLEGTSENCGSEWCIWKATGFCCHLGCPWCPNFMSLADSSGSNSLASVSWPLRGDNNRKGFDARNEMGEKACKHVLHHRRCFRTLKG